MGNTKRPNATEDKVDDHRVISNVTLSRTEGKYLIVIGSLER